MQNKYPFYFENPYVGAAVVRAVNGEIEYYSNCIRRNGIYYIKHIHAVYQNDEWVVLNPSVYDHELKQNTTNTHDLFNGIVDFNKETLVPVKGWFTKNPYTNCIVSIMGKHYTFINCDLLKNNPSFTEDLATGVFYITKELTPGNIRILTKKRVINYGDNVYNIVDSPKVFERSKSLYAASKINIDNDIKLAGRYLKNVTFGAEFETINGGLPNYFKDKYGIIICKDGSIKNEDGAYPPEYVTVPLSGVKGVQTLRDVSKEIAKRSDFDIKCSYHLHLGGFNYSRLFLVSLYKLSTKIQDDLFGMFPFYKRDEVKYAGKEKNYCKKLPNIVMNYKGGNFNTYLNSSYQDIYHFLSGGYNFDSDYNFKKKVNPWGNNKWQINSRYYWLNFTNLVFGKQNTIEFRLHTPTTNSDKVINWLFMCNAIMEFAKNNTKKCLSDEEISFTDVLNFYGKTYKTSHATNLSKNLIAYYNARVSKFKQEADAGKYISDDELLFDGDFKFNALA
jgi:hypothetical protein